MFQQPGSSSDKEMVEEVNERKRELRRRIPLKSRENHPLNKSPTRHLRVLRDREQDRELRERPERNKEIRERQERDKESRERPEREKPELDKESREASEGEKHTEERARPEGDRSEKDLKEKEARNKPELNANNDEKEARCVDAPNESIRWLIKWK